MKDAPRDAGAHAPSERDRAAGCTAAIFPPPAEGRRDSLASRRKRPMNTFERQVGVGIETAAKASVVTLDVGSTCPGER